MNKTKPTAQLRQRPEALKLHWKDGRTSLLAGSSFHGNDLVEKLQPLYLAQGVTMASYTAASEQLAFSMYRIKLNELDDKTAEQCRDLARVIVNAAIGVN